MFRVRQGSWCRVCALYLLAKSPYAHWSWALSVLGSPYPHWGDRVYEYSHLSTPHPNNPHRATPTAIINPTLTIVPTLTIIPPALPDPTSALFCEPTALFKFTPPCPSQTHTAPPTSCKARTTRVMLSPLWSWGSNIARRATCL